MRHIFSKKNRALLSELVRTDFKLRYQGSALGYAWSLLRPLLMFLILYLVFVRLIPLGKDVPHYPVYLLLGIVLWNFFNEMTIQSLGSVVARGDLIRKIKIPRWIIVISSSLSALINLGLNLVIVLIFMFVDQVDFMKTGLWFPIILLQVYVFALGLSLFLSAAYVKYRDVSYIWDVIMQALFYLTPILYPLSLIKDVTFQKLIMLNPMAQAIQDSRSVLVTREGSTTISDAYGFAAIRLVPIVVCIVVLIIGVLYFRRESKHFAENL